MFSHHAFILILLSIRGNLVRSLITRSNFKAYSGTLRYNDYNRYQNKRHTNLFFSHFKSFWIAHAVSPAWEEKDRGLSLNAVCISKNQKRKFIVSLKRQTSLRDSNIKYVSQRCTIGLFLMRRIFLRRKQDEKTFNGWLSCVTFDQYSFSHTNGIFFVVSNQTTRCQDVCIQKQGCFYFHSSLLSIVYDGVV